MRGSQAHPDYRVDVSFPFLLRSSNGWASVFRSFRFNFSPPRAIHNFRNSLVFFRRAVTAWGLMSVFIQHAPQIVDIILILTAQSL
jgi:hypothetical protein